MNYRAQEVEQFLSQKQFIDTAIVPLVPIDFSNESGMRSASETEFLMSLATYIEKQFKGRIFLTPPFSYFHKEGTIEISKLSSQLKEEAFKHVMFLACDVRWKDYEGNDMLWLPAIPVESLDLEVKNRIMQDQLNYVIPKLTELWTTV